MTQKLEWKHILEANHWLQNRPSFSITEMCSVPCNLNTRITIPNHAQNEELEQDSQCFGVDLAEGQDRSVLVQGVIYRRDNIYEITGMSEIRTDCKYFSGNHLLFCAVNTNCEGCVDYCLEK